jgi:hypothetical protein
MTTHLSNGQIDGFRRGTLAGDELAAVIRHLADCRECGAKARAAAFAVASELAGEDHPDVDELFAFADGTLDRARRLEIEEHLRDCTRCSEDVADARRENARLHPRQPVWRLAVAAAIGIVVAGAAFWLTRPVALITRPPRLIVHIPLPPTRSEWDPIVSEARRARAVPMPTIVRELRGTSDTLRGPGSAAAKLDMHPIGVVVASQQPAFTWRAQSGERYIVTVVCDDAVAAKSAAIATGTWTPAKPLPRGANCVWQLERLSDHAILPSPPAPQPMFRVLDARTLAEIARAGSQTPRDDLAIGLLYARAGVRDAAEEHLGAYATAHPADDAAAAILRSVQRW